MRALLDSSIQCVRRSSGPVWSRQLMRWSRECAQRERQADVALRPAGSKRCMTHTCFVASMCYACVQGSADTVACPAGPHAGSGRGWRKRRVATSPCGRPKKCAARRGCLCSLRWPHHRPSATRGAGRALEISPASSSSWSESIWPGWRSAGTQRPACSWRRLWTT